MKRRFQRNGVSMTWRATSAWPVRQGKRQWYMTAEDSTKELALWQVEMTKVGCRGSST
jgi:hypothetical protein